MANPTDRRASVDVVANKTLTAADSGIVQNVVGDGITITLPATALELNYTIRAGGVKISANGTAGSVQDGSQTINVTPNAADGITGNGFTAAVTKGAVLGATAASKAAARIGDQLEISGSGTTGVTGWVVQNSQGVWTRQA